jgi:hypothetical protein
MDLNFTAIRKFLEGLNYSSYSNLNEYQDKFYLKKEIQSFFLEIPDEVIYNAIDLTNNRLKENYLSRKYIVLLSGEILNLYGNYRKNGNL